MKPPMFQLSGFFDDRTRSVASETFAKSNMKLSSSITKAETTNFPVKINAKDTKPAVRIV